jgi:hypothetical protein
MLSIKLQPGLPRMDLTSEILLHEAGCVKVMVPFQIMNLCAGSPDLSQDADNVAMLIYKAGYVSKPEPEIE